MGIVIGYILTGLGIGGFSYSCYTMQHTHRYTWRPPYSDFETRIIAFCIVSFIMFVLGIMLIIFSVIKRKNQAKLSQITGKVDNVALANICCNC